MTIYLIGHDYRYAAEQMLMTLFPGERAQIAQEHDEDEPPEDYLMLQLDDLGEHLRAEAELCLGGELSEAKADCPRPNETDVLDYDRQAQKILKLAFYRASLPFLPQKPRWGALTGVRPVKLPTRIRKQGGDRAAAKRLLLEEYDVDEAEAEIAATCAEYAFAADASLAENELALYIGIPFCPTRCAYCSFVSAAVGQQQKLLVPYLEALHKEIRAAGEGLRRQNAVVSSVYIGGGTPTTLSAPQLKELLEQIVCSIDLSQCREFTVEAGRPDTITEQKLRTLQRFPVTRISINPQTMHNETLRLIGRGHSLQQLTDAFDMAARVAPELLVNADLIMGLPQETAEMFAESLEQLLAYQPANITVHTLAVKRAADLTAHSASAQTLEEMYCHANERLADAGYLPYYLYRQKDMGGSFANIGWTKPGCESLYNLCMMEELCSTVALGATGISKLVNRKTGKITRKNNPKYAAEYVKRISHIMDEKEWTQWIMT